MRRTRYYFCLGASTALTYHLQVPGQASAFGRPRPGKKGRMLQMKKGRSLKKGRVLTKEKMLKNLMLKKTRQQWPGSGG
jgi:hypothetical protein